MNDKMNFVVKEKWCYECNCSSKDCVCPDWHRHEVKREGEK